MLSPPPRLLSSFFFFFLVLLFERVSALTGVTVGTDLILNIKGLNLFQKSMNEFRSAAAEGAGGT